MKGMFDFADFKSKARDKNTSSIIMYRWKAEVLADELDGLQRELESTRKAYADYIARFNHVAATCPGFPVEAWNKAIGEYDKRRE